MVEFFTLEYYGKIHRFVKGPKSFQYYGEIHRFVKGSNSLFKFGEIRWNVCYCTHEEKLNLQGFNSKCLRWQPATAFWGGVIVLTPTRPARLQNKIWQSTKHMMQVSVSFCAMNLSLTINSCFQCFLQAVLGNNLIFYYTHWTNHPLSRDRS